MRVFVTGLPRSGTTLLLNLLHGRYPDHEVFCEPIWEAKGNSQLNLQKDNVIHKETWYNINQRRVVNEQLKTLKFDKVYCTQRNPINIFNSWLEFNLADKSLATFIECFNSYQEYINQLKNRSVFDYDRINEEGYLVSMGLNEFKPFDSKYGDKKACKSTKIDKTTKPLKLDKQTIKALCNLKY